MAYLAFPVAILFALFAWWNQASGRATFGREASVARSENPGAFWLIQSGYAALVVGLTVVGVLGVLGHGPLADHRTP